MKNNEESVVLLHKKLSVLSETINIAFDFDTINRIANVNDMYIAEELDPDNTLRIIGFLLFKGFKLDFISLMIKQDLAVFLFPANVFSKLWTEVVKTCEIIPVNGIYYKFIDAYNKNYNTPLPGIHGIVVDSFRNDQD